MIRHQIDSSSVQSLGYDHADQTLEVEFTSGRVYRYLAVPSSEVERLATAASVGRYLNEKIKGAYRYRRIG